jgi:hypothetical protein
MKNMAINFQLIFIIIIFLDFSSANFSIESPDIVNINQTFKVNIQSNITEDSDVKIFILDEQNKTISKIMNQGVWKSSYYYVLSSFPRDKSYSLLAIKSGDYQICAKLRSQNKKIIDSPCNQISIKEISLVKDEESLNDEIQEQEVKSEKSQEINETPSEKRKEVKRIKENISFNEIKIENISNQELNDSPISLKSTYLSKKQDANQFNLLPLIFFSTFVLFIIFLILIRKL